MQSIEVRRNINRYGESLTKSSNSETVYDEDGNYIRTYAAGTSIKAIVNLISAEEVVEKYGKYDGESLEILTQDAVAEHDRVIFDANTYIITKTRNARWRGAGKGTFGVLKLEVGMA